MAFDSRDDVAAKINWEGGLYAALEYGLTVDDLPQGDEALHAAWAAMQIAWQHAEEKAAVVAKLLGIEGQ